MTAALPKYARWEHERRFLIAPTADRPWDGSASKQIEDRYLDAGRLRLRRIRSPEGPTYKLCKKFPHETAYSQPIVNIYLGAEEYQALRALPGHGLCKRRFRHTYDGHEFAVDVFEGALSGLVLCEIEADSLDELMAVPVPSAFHAEVTADPAFQGGRLCRTSTDELAGHLRRLGAGRAAG